MTFLRASALLLALAALARPARADDAATAAAAMDAIGKAGVATGGAPGADRPGHKKNDDGGFARHLSAPKIEKTSDGGPDHATANKKTSAKTKASKYKSRELTENSESVYRFNENAEPLNAPPKKKAAAKTKNKVSSETDDKDEKAEACSSDEACAEKKSEADAF